MVESRYSEGNLKQALPVATVSLFTTINFSSWLRPEQTVLHLTTKEIDCTENLDRVPRPTALTLFLHPLHPLGHKLAPACSFCSPTLSIVNTPSISFSSSSLHHFCFSHANLKLPLTHFLLPFRSVYMVISQFRLCSIHGGIVCISDTKRIALRSNIMK